MVFKIVVALILAIILIYMIIQIFKDNKTRTAHRPPPADSRAAYRDCPICGSPLKRGETVHSHLYRGKPDGMMYIYGCPFCYKDHPRPKEVKAVRRICPYCKTDIPESGWVIARVFEKPEKTHVHVLGCTVCRKI